MCEGPKQIEQPNSVDCEIKIPYFAFNPQISSNIFVVSIPNGL